jgi:NADH:ubiquinone reductase (H+-translocating)
MAGTAEEDGAHRIVVAGGGAGGLELVTRLGDTLARAGKARVTLVDCARTHLWKPLLHEVAAGSLLRSAHELDYLAQAQWHGFTYVFGEAAGLDRDARRLQVKATFDEDGRQITPPRSLPYDTLVMAIGSVTNDFGTPGAAEHAVPLDTPDEAERFHRRLVNACLRANAQDGPIRPGQLSVAIIGAGATGSELSAELHRTVRAIVGYGLDRIDPARDVRIVLIEAAPRILPALPERMANAAQDRLETLGVEVRVGSRVSAVRADGVVLESGELIASELVVWAAGVKAPPVLAGFNGLETNRQGQLNVLPTLQTTLDPDVFAIGDCAACPQPGKEAPVPPRAQAAHQMASHMVGQIRRRLAERPLEPYRYHDFGSLVSLGAHSTVGNLMGFISGKGLFIEGAFAGLVYRSLYAMHEAALHGGRAVAWRTLVGMLGSGPTPAVKLH